MAAGKRLLAAAEKIIGLTEKAMRPSVERTPEKALYFTECMDGKHLGVFGRERIAAIRAMLESHC